MRTERAERTEDVSTRRVQRSLPNPDRNQALTQSEEAGLQQHLPLLPPLRRPLKIPWWRDSRCYWFQWIKLTGLVKVLQRKQKSLGYLCCCFLSRIVLCNSFLSSSIEHLLHWCHCVHLAEMSPVLLSLEALY
ncbi:hypothetical protein EYF80_004572 [Liparis tanakae]|uniref:Uncharacterized protein n=1 Tax=Liparis tanakae TaxID=230148 RepID=A0A4Z2J6Z6_9TELE|nr:hypothetical protein EYF80_004572 [Liparis tanakae]